MENSSNTITFMLFSKNIYTYCLTNIRTQLQNNFQKDEFNSYLEEANNTLNKYLKATTSKNDKDSYMYVKKYINKSKFNIVNFKELENKAIEKFVNKNDSIEVQEKNIEQIKAICLYLQKKGLTLKKITQEQKEYSKKYYRKNKILIKLRRIEREKELGIVRPGNKTGASDLERLKRLKSLSIVFNIYKDLERKIANKEIKSKITGLSIYNIIKTDYNDCLKQRQIGKYLKEIKTNFKLVENELKEINSLEEKCNESKINKEKILAAKLLAKKERSVKKFVKHNQYLSNLISSKKDKISIYLEKEELKRKIA